MWSASRSASSRYWVVSTTVVPASVSSSTTSHSPARARGSRPVVGSSRNSTDGDPTRLAARSIRRREPPESSPTRRVAYSCSPSRSISASARARAVRRSPVRRPISSRFSRAVRNSSSPAYWPVTPIRRRTSVASATTSRPSICTRPMVGRTRVVERADQGGLAGTVVAEHPERGPGGSLQVDAVEGPRFAVGDVQILDHDGRGAHRTPPNR